MLGLLLLSKSQSIEKRCNNFKQTKFLVTNCLSIEILIIMVALDIMVITLKKMQKTFKHIEVIVTFFQKILFKIIMKNSNYNDNFLRKNSLL